MVDGVVFDNFLITSDQSIAKQYADQIWYPKSVLEGKAISSASESVIDAIVNATKNRPWLWAVYLVAILLPIVILVVFCWTRKPTKEPTDGLRKKTDKIEPDSNEQQELNVSDNEEAGETESNKQQVETNVSSKDALENDDKGQTEEESGVEEDNVRIFSSGLYIFLQVIRFVFKTVETNTDENNRNSSPSAGSKPHRRTRKE